MGHDIMAAKRDLMRILTDPTQFHLIEKHLYSYIEGIHIGQGQGDSYREIPTTSKLINFSNPMSLQLIVRNEASNRIAFFQSDSTWTGNQFIQLKLFGDSMGVIDSAPGRIVTFQVPHLFQRWPRLEKGVVQRWNAFRSRQPDCAV